MLLSAATESLPNIPLNITSYVSIITILLGICRYIFLEWKKDKEDNRKQEREIAKEYTDKLTQIALQATKALDNNTNTMSKLIESTTKMGERLERVEDKVDRLSNNAK